MTITKEQACQEYLAQQGDLSYSFSEYRGEIKYGPDEQARSFVTSKKGFKDLSKGLPVYYGCGPHRKDKPTHRQHDAVNGYIALHQVYLVECKGLGEVVSKVLMDDFYS